MLMFRPAHGISPSVQDPAVTRVTKQDMLAKGDQQTDLSGNPILRDAGVWLRSELKAGIKGADLKYIDPSYLIRSIPTTSGDRIYCKVRPGLPGSCSSALMFHALVRVMRVELQEPHPAEPAL